MGLPQYFISCDWGTTNFRLRLVETESLNVLHQYKTNIGVKNLYEKFLKSQKTNQFSYFANYLILQLENLPENHQNHLIILAGMASSNIGLKELDYAAFPFNKSGENLNYELVSLEKGRDILLISGVKNKTGMMRGEEIQAVGLSPHLAPYSKAVLLLPGTHSKHITFSDGKFVSLKNFMTGELFEILSKKSILSNSVLDNPWNEDREDAFKDGLQVGFKGELTSHLLSTRVRDVIQHLSKNDNYYYLSGLLIGDEISYLRNSNETIFLAASNSTFDMYQQGLEMIIDNKKLKLLNDEALEKALLFGQKKILLNYGK